jgi:uncharacterized membrane protein required for colicin V production
MIPIHTVFGVLLVLFAMIGSLRGWAREIIVTFSVVLALFVEHVILTFVLPLKGVFENMPAESQFYTRGILFIILTVFGYASPNIVSQLGAKVVRERLQDLMLGFFLGAINGFLIVGTLLFFLSTIHYGVPPDMWSEQQKTDANGEPIVDSAGNPVTEVVYHPDARGIGGIAPPGPDSTTTALTEFLPPKLIARSNAALYIAVAAAFVFVIVVFI